MQSLQADQSLYNRKGVCYIVLLSVFCRSRIILVPDAKISIFLEKMASHISNDFTQFQKSHYSFYKEELITDSLCLAPGLEAEEHLCQVGVVVEVVDEHIALI